MSQCFADLFNFAPPASREVVTSLINNVCQLGRANSLSRPIRVAGHQQSMVEKARECFPVPDLHHSKKVRIERLKYADMQRELIYTLSDY